MKISGKPSLMKRINKNIILNLIIENDAISRAKLSRLTKISKPTMSNLIKSLEKDNYVKIKGIGAVAAKGGKKPILYEFNKDYGYIIGSQLRINEIKTIITNYNAEILYETTLEIGKKRDKKTILNKLFNTFEDVINNSRVDKNKIKGISLGLSGIVDQKKGLLLYSSHYQELGRNFEFVKLIKEKFNMKVLVDNSARMMACAEKIFGSGRDYNNIVTIDTEEGIGCGIIIKGEIYRGSDYLAGEIGHTIVDPNGPKCYCGKNGCIEKMISTRVILDEVSSDLLKNKDSIIYKKFKNTPNKIKLKDIFDAYISNDRFICSIFEKIENWFAVFIGNIILNYNPEVIIISGDYVDGSNKFIERVKEKTVKKIFPFLDIKPNILLSSLGKSSGTIGSVSLLLSKEINFHNIWDE